MLEPAGPNAEQIQYWNALAGRKWVTFQPFIDLQLNPLGQHVMQRLHLTAGERILDVGCGCGGCSVELARRVGPTGRVTGIDLSTLMLERAGDSARAAGLTSVHFENADAQTHRFPPGSFDVVFSRLGVMFFRDPAAAFTNLAQALRPGGRVGFVCWQELQRNVWMHVPLNAAQPYLPPQPRPEPNAPGPFAFADPERVRGILTCAGLAAVQIEALHVALSIGGGQSLDETVATLLHIGPLGRALGDVEECMRARIAETVRKAIEPFVTLTGVRMASAAWVVTAQRPA